MSSVKRPPSDPPGQRGSRRPGRTIDLTVSEIASEPVASTATEQPAAAESAPVTPQVSVEDAPLGFPQASAAATAEPSVGEMTTNPPTESGASGSEPPPPPGPERDNSASPDTREPRSLPWGLIGIGAAVVVLALLAFSLLGPSFNRDQDTTALDSRLAQVERRLAEIAGRPAAASVDTKTIDDLAARLTRLEAAIAAPRPAAADPALTNRIGTLEGEIKALGERIDVVARRSDEIATAAADARARADAAAAAVAALPKAAPPPPPAPPAPPAVARGEVEALANRVTALEQAAKALETAIARRATAEASDDRTVRLAVTAALLQATVERGDPFAKELAAAKTLAGDAAKALAPLEPFAVSGVPSASALTRELSALVPALRQASSIPARDGTFLERLQANAEKLVRIRPLDAPGDDPAAILARIELRAAQSDLAGALAELAKLPPAARAPAQEWIAKAETRNAAIEASRKYAADALAALGQPAP
jgi:hypothetical protein